MTKKAPTPPRLDTARELVRRQWLNPTEDGLKDARRSLVRRMWQARRRGFPEHRAQLRNLYLKICEQQRQRDWEIGVYERTARYRARLEPHQLMREQVQKQGKARAVGLNVPQEGEWTPPVPQRVMLHRPAPGTAAPEEVLKPLPRGRRALSTIRQTSVAHLARVLYLAHLHGWRSLSLSTSYSRPGDIKRVSDSGFVEFACRCAFDSVIVDVSALITSSEYRRALERLTGEQQEEIRLYYLRSASDGDTCPALGRWEYAATAQAFSALLDELFAQGSLTQRLDKITQK